MQCALMQALAAQGDRAGMTLVYRQFRLLLHEQLQGEPSPETKALYGRLRGESGKVSGDKTSPDPVARPQSPAEPIALLHIPRPISNLVGRSEESDKVTALLLDSRLVTLTGTGGVGKTRLALDVSAQVAPRFQSGVWFVDLAPITKEALTINAIAAALQLREEAGQAWLQTLCRYLADKELLLMLDNCEHLLDACAALVTDLLHSAPGLRVLATSRQGLGVTGERVWRVPSLAVPEPSPSGDLLPETLLEWPATRLFVERAQEASAHFTVTARNARFVADICRRLDGIPLAIELAAARVKVLSVEEINTRLDNRFRLLTGGSRTVLPRQQTLRALIDWSYDLLSASEKLLLCRLSVFAGGWTLEAAEQAGAGESATGARMEEWETLDVMASLVDKSLVLAQPQGETVRYRLLETVRQYAIDRLIERGEYRTVRARHGLYFLSLAEEIKPKLRGAQQAQWLEVLEEEHDNLRQALTFYAEDTQDAESGEKGLRLGAAMQMFWYTRGYLSEGRERLAALLAHPGGQNPARVRADALNGAGVLAYNQSAFVEARSFYEESLEIRRESGDKMGIIASLSNLGHVANMERDFARARRLYEESLALRRKLGDKIGIANSLNNLGNVAKSEDSYVSAQVLYEESLAIQREMGDKIGIANSLNNLGQVMQAQGGHDSARLLYEESLALRRDLAHKDGIANCLRNLGNLAYAQSDYAHARALHEESLAIWRELGDKIGVVNSLHNSGQAAQAQGDYVAARVLHQKSLTMARELEEVEGVACGLEAFSSLALNERQEERSACLWGAAAMLRETFSCPLRLADQEEHNRRIANLAAALDPDIYQAALARGRSMGFEQAIEYALGNADTG